MKPFLPIILALVLTPAIHAGDWPNILGPNRNGVAQNEAPLKPWPKSGPKLAWEIEVGAGFAGAAIVEQTVVIFHRIDDEEIVQALKLADGTEIWKQTFPTTSSGSYSPDGGPLCVPTIHKDSVIAFGVSGNLHCMNLADGAVKWSHNLHDKFDAPFGYFGAGSCPIVHETDTATSVLVNAGGKDGGIVSFNLADGETNWAKTDMKASYSSPIMISHRDKPTAIFVTRFDTVAIDPDSGEQHFSIPFGERGPTVNGATPLVKGDRLFLTASYRIGGKMFDISGDQPKLLWENDETLSSQYSTALWHKDHLFGVHGREDIPGAALNCIDAATGKIKWSHKESVPAHLIRIGEQMLIWTVEGELRLANLSTTAYEELATATIFTTPSRALPAYSNNNLIIRSNAINGTGKMKCLKLSSTQ